MKKTELSAKDIHKLQSIVDKLAVSEQMDSATRVITKRYEPLCFRIPLLSRSTCAELGIEFGGNVAQFIGILHDAIKTNSFEFEVDK